MATKIEDIYKNFVEAMDAYNTAVDMMNEAVTSLKSAERKLQKAMDDFTSNMGEQINSAENEPDTSLLGKLSGSTKDLSNIFDIGSWF